MTENVRAGICPDCGRIKATTVNSILRGDCPKWYAITDLDADLDCRMEQQRKDILREMPTMKGDDPLSQPSGLRAVRECEHHGKHQCFTICPFGETKCFDQFLGLISRDIPISEAVEWANNVTKQLTGWSRGEFLLKLPSGERVEVGG